VWLLCQCMKPNNTYKYQSKDKSRNANNNKKEKDYTYSPTPPTTTPVTIPNSNDDVTEENGTIYTVGYAGFSNSRDFVKHLQKYNITTLIDIRIRPNSNFKDYNSYNLEKILLDGGIHYEHYLELGNVFKDNKDPSVGENPFMELIRTGGEILTRRLRNKINNNKHEKICIMCACKDPMTCHRNSVSGYLKETWKMNVIHCIEILDS